MGRELSGALVSMLLALVMSNVGLLPAAAPQYNTVNRFLLPLAVPLLLFSADLRRIIRDTGNLLKCFVIGSVTTVIGTLAAMKLMPLVALGVDSWKVASALCARHIGGAVNFVAVAETLGLSASATAAGLASDNLVSALYFLALYWLGRNIPSESQSDGQLPGAGTADDQASDSSGGGRIAVLEGLTALSISAAVCYLGVSVATAIGMPGLSLPIITLLTVALASAAPALLAPFVESAEGLALMLLQMFFAAIGASGSIAAVLQTAPALFGFSLIQIVVHLALLLASGRLLRAPLRDVLLASNANVGGPTTAAGMAATKGWKRLVVPSLLVGTLGYAIATFIAVLLGLKVLLPMAAASGAVAPA